MPTKINIIVGNYILYAVFKKNHLSIVKYFKINILNIFTTNYTMYSLYFDLIITNKLAMHT